MTALDGTCDFYIRPASWSAASGYRYVADRRDFAERQRIDIKGTIEQSNPYFLLINGEKHVAAMQIEVTIRTAHDYDFGDTTARQIRFLKDGPTTEIVSKATG